MDFLKKLQWRYATKHMNGTKVSNDKLDVILNAIQLAPNSIGIQPFKVFVVESEDVRKKIHASACPQPQIIEGSHLLVFAAREELTNDEVEEYVNRIATKRNVPVESLGDFKKMIMSVQGMSKDDYATWAAKQTYIALGFGLVAAAEVEVDSTPMEGFSAPAMDEILGLRAKGYRSSVLLALGYRDSKTDYLVNAAKVRKSNSALFEMI
ncbi:NAD(P)H-dependent oxidoreductase [Williamwhitmania taraxaci]|uniref:Nitroreductase n=1 Tax=Williamwhitmania taraxaci TaxID=1640674 RepID=A0A1G6KQ96_9BACT|nr:NAD(P)H-dependent oxidoreductase [Williamwhitmania taraxaci]SDC33077.1 Nitroreductase [Williamwhitmania taraxaci]